MASYAALLSAMYTLNQIKKHPRPPISLDPNQVDSLTQNLTFFRTFLERYSGEEDGELESRIAAAAYETEDVIESHIVHRIHSEPSHLYRDLEKAIQGMDVIKEMIVEEKMGDKLPGKLVVAASMRRRSSTDTMIEFDDVLINQVLDKLTGHQAYLQAIPIVGMGGIGKTSLARNIYTNPLIVEHFDILVWVTISQKYSVSEMFLRLLSREDDEGRSEHELGGEVHKKLWDRRYLIVMDDIWGIEAWDRVPSFFPNNNNGSRVMITTRLSNLAFELTASQVFQMDFLDEDKSWTLFCKTVFDEEGCPIELECVAKKIVRNCRGLPLSIVVIGGLLTNTNMAPTYWEYILQDLTSFINLDNDEYCLQLLLTSYKELPVHLKPCFLYMGIFPEDDKIRVSELIKLWVAEGIVRPSEGMLLEEVAVEYIDELLDRNLISIYALRWNGEVKFCKIHDLLRDLCLREAKKQRFLCAMKDEWDLNIPECMAMERRICINGKSSDEFSSQFFHALESASLARSFILYGWYDLTSSLSYMMLKVFSVFYIYDDSGLASVEAIFQNVNLRYLTISIHLPPLSRFTSSWIFLWNLQTIKVRSHCPSPPITAPSDIWEMLLLRHVSITNLQLPDPPCGENDVILEDLQTLSCVTNLKISKAVIKRIPNIKTLKIMYDLSSWDTEYHKFCVNNFGHLNNLQSLNLDTGLSETLFNEEFQSYMGNNLNFPHSLKKFTLSPTTFNWDECMTKIGSLPFLEFLKLHIGNYWGPEWEKVGGQFRSLKILHIGYCTRLKYWRMDDETHFPRLQHLLLEFLYSLEEIPSSIGDIPTLLSISMNKCSDSAADSARRIKQEQIELGNVDLQLYIDGNVWVVEEEGEAEEDEEDEDTRTIDMPADYDGVPGQLEIRSDFATTENFITDQPHLRTTPGDGSLERDRTRRRLKWRKLLQRCGCCGQLNRNH